MNVYRIKMLEDIGFVWDHHQLAWEKHYEKLKEYKNKLGHCNLPTRCPCPAHQALSTWCYRQRDQYKRDLAGKKSNLTLKRIKALEGIGFQWSLRSYKMKPPAVNSCA
mmetsp:Transcript_31859/g.48474  ORF Transcript_31859/g.48474 Transcript_31859/m.48474 type:complete len:108 (-) Transcript_31859:36-359(-)